jgi:hypothetical protein
MVDGRPVDRLVEKLRLQIVLEEVSLLHARRRRIGSAIITVIWQALSRAANLRRNKSGPSVAERRISKTRAAGASRLRELGASASGG